MLGNSLIWAMPGYPGSRPLIAPEEREEPERRREAGGSVAGVLESRNMPGMLPVLSLLIFTAIGGPLFDFWSGVQNLPFLKKYQYQG